MTISDFNTTLSNTTLSNKSSCGTCPMYSKQFVGMDSSTGLVQSFPILFLGLNPGTIEAKTGLPFTGSAGQLFRKAIKEAGLNSWAMINSLLCSSPNEASIPNVALCQKHYRNKVVSVVREVSPLCIVPTGNSACAMFSIPDKISVASQKIYFSRGPSETSTRAVVAPLVHPSAILRNGGENSSAYESFVKRLRDIQEMFSRPLSHEEAMTYPQLRGHIPLLFTNRYETW